MTASCAPTTGDHDPEAEEHQRVGHPQPCRERLQQQAASPIAATAAIDLADLVGGHARDSLVASLRPRFPLANGGVAG